MNIILHWLHWIATHVPAPVQWLAMLVIAMALCSAVEWWLARCANNEENAR